jgi:hypothetical protein
MGISAISGGTKYLIVVSELRGKTLLTPPTNCREPCIDLGIGHPLHG